MKYSVCYGVTIAIWAVILELAIPTTSFFVWLTRSSFWFLTVRLLKHFVFRRIDIETRFKNKETVVVTGASCGIGAQTASILCERGGKVIWTARDVDKAQQFLDDLRWTYDHGPRGYVLYLDLASKKSIRKFVDEFKKREKKLDCVVLNAAYHGPRRLTSDGFEQNLGVNHLGHMYLVYLLMDMLKASPHARIVVVASDLHKFTKRVRFDDLQFERDYTLFAAYNHSKLLNILFARELARRLKGTNVTVYAAHPGTPINSELMRNSWAGSFAINQLLLPFATWLSGFRTTFDGAQTPVYCALSDACARDTGKYYENLRVDKASDVATDDAAAAKLWDVSCDLLEIEKDWP